MARPKNIVLQCTTEYIIKANPDKGIAKKHYPKGSQVRFNDCKEAINFILANDRHFAVLYAPPVKAYGDDWSGLNPKPIKVDKPKPEIPKVEPKKKSKKRENSKETSSKKSDKSK